MTGLKVPTKEQIMRLVVRIVVQLPTKSLIDLKCFTSHFNNNILITFAIGYLSAI